MERERQIISETIKYARRFHGSRIVVRLDDKVAVDALERGLCGEIDKIRQAGVNIVVAHSKPEINRIERGASTDGMLNAGKVENHSDFGMSMMVYFKETGSAGDNAAVDLALEQKARKLIFITRARGVFHPPDKLLRQLSVGEARELLTNHRAVTGAMRGKLETSIVACNRGVDRVHIIGSKEGNLLREIFTCDGVGTMIYAKTYEQIRRAEVQEISDVIEILRMAISQSRAQSYFDSTLVTKAIGDFWVFSVDDDIHGCMQLTDHQDCKMLEVACLAVTPRYENQDVLERLLRRALEDAGANKRRGVFINIKENTFCLPIYPWFMRLGFKRDVSSQISRIDKNAGSDCWVCET